MANFTIASSRVLGCMLGAMCYGIYVCLFTIAMRRIAVAFQQGARYKVVPSVLIGLFVASTAGIALTLTDNYRAILLYEGGVHKFYTDYPTGSILMAGTDLCTWFSMNLADAFLIWRLYIIWNHNKYIIILPILMLLAGLGSGLATVISEFGDILYVVNEWAYVMIVMTVTLNILVTGLICGRLWFIGRRSAQGLGIPGYSPNYKLYSKVIILLVESGGIYSSLVLLWALLHAGKAVEAANVVSYITPPVSSIVPTVISIRLNSAIRRANTQQTLPFSTSSQPSYPRATVAHQTRVEAHALAELESKAYQITISPATEERSEGHEFKRAPSFSVEDIRKGV